MLTSREFGTSSTDLRRTFAQLLKRLCIEELESKTSPSIYSLQVNTFRFKTLIFMFGNRDKDKHKLSETKR